MGTVDLTYTGLAVGMLLMLIPFYFLWRFRTGLLSSALWGTVRMTVQLLLIGVYLRFLFQWDNEWVNVLWMAVMAVIASHTAVSRTALRREVRSCRFSRAFWLRSCWCRCISWPS